MLYILSFVNITENKKSKLFLFGATEHKTNSSLISFQAYTVRHLHLFFNGGFEILFKYTVYLRIKLHDY